MRFEGLGVGGLGVWGWEVWRQKRLRRPSKSAQ